MVIVSLCGGDYFDIVTETGRDIARIARALTAKKRYRAQARNGNEDGFVFFDFGNIGSEPIMVGFLADGSLVQVNTINGAVTQMAPAGTIAYAQVTTTRDDWYVGQAARNYAMGPLN